ncbi:glycosyltransferase [Pedococcus aerophilus]|uniref:Glycosyltransferase n=1 Tax=Pedococcus aerophilus TaxID=436356 RepID=A0ABN3UVZ4_9MICO
MDEHKILVISDFDPSSPFIGSLRVDRFAMHLTSFGWSVKVVSPIGVTVYRQDGKDAPAGSTERHYTRTVRRGLAGVVYRALLWVFYHVVAFPDRGIFTVPRIRRHVSALDDWRPDVVLVSGPPFSTFLVGRRLAKEWGVPWVADYRDLWTDSNYYLCGPFRRRVDRVVERWILRTVALTLTVSEPLAEDLRRDFGVRCEVVMNGYEADEFGSERAPTTTGLPVRVVYTGEVHPGRSDPAAFLEGIKSLGVGPETLRVEFRGITVMPLADQARALGLEQIVHVAHAVPRAESVKLQQASDVQLLLLWNDPGEVGNYSGKLFEYLGSGRPILMMGYRDGVAARLIEERGAGQVANTPSEVADALSCWIDEKRSTGSVAGTGPNTVAGLTRREQTAVLVEHLADLLGTSAESGARWAGEPGR